MAEGVAKLLQMHVIPSMFVVFMPRSMEDELAKIELECAKQFSGAKQEDIIRTVFNVSFVKGKPVFTVRSQTTK